MPVYKRNRHGRIVDDREEGVFYYDFVVEGRRYKKAIVGIRTRKQAEKIEEKRRFAVYSGDDNSKSGRITFEKFINEVYLPYQKLREIRTYYNYECFCRQACRFFKNRTLQEIERDPDLIERFLLHRCNGLTNRGTKRKRNTVNHEKAMLSGVFRLAIKKKYCKSNPCQSVDSLPDADNRRTAIITFEDESRLLAALSGDKEKYRPIVILGLYTGMRRCEILNLRWEWINLEKRELTLPGSVTKNKKERTIALNQNALNVLVQLKENSQDMKRVFPNNDGSGFSPKHVSTVISKACDEIGAPDATMHTTRHTFNTRLIEQKVNPLYVRELMGHSSLEMTGHYFHANRESLHEAVTALEKRPDESSAVPEQSEGHL